MVSPKTTPGLLFQESQIDTWDLEVPLHFYRRKLSDTPAKNHQLDFYNGRYRMEVIIAELKGEFAFDVIPTRHYQVNSAHQQISLLAYNLVMNFQMDTKQVSE